MRDKISVVRLQMVKDGEVEYGGCRMDSPKKAAEVIRGYLDGTDREHMVVCAVDAKGCPTFIQTVGIGTIQNFCFSVGDIFKSAIISNAVNLLLFHNHPSGDPAPSPEDRDATRRIRDVGELLGIHLLDHIIIGEDSYYSFRENEGCREG